MLDADAPDIVRSTALAGSRIRASLDYFRFTLSGRNFSGDGPDLAFESALNERWSAGAGIAQAYSIAGSVQTLFTSFEGAIWYSVWGTFGRRESEWKQHGTALISYQPKARPGLRLGVAMQQYFFNTQNAAVPFSGVAVKAAYELGLPWSFDVALGLEAGRLVNASLHASSLKASISLLLPLE